MKKVPYLSRPAPNNSEEAYEYMKDTQTYVNNMRSTNAYKRYEDTGWGGDYVYDDSHEIKILNHAAKACWKYLLNDPELVKQFKSINEKYGKEVFPHEIPITFKKNSLK